MKTGKLYAIGVGPGDADLITLKALKRLQSTKTIAYPVNEQGISMAKTVIAEYISHDHQQLTFSLPVLGEPAEINAAYHNAAKDIKLVLEQGEDVCVLCLGDPLFYGSFIHLWEKIGPHYHCEIIPGINSPSLLASKTKTPIAKHDQKIAIVSGQNNIEEIRDCLRKFDTIIILKPGRHKTQLLELIETENRHQECIYGEFLGGEQEHLITDFKRIKNCADAYFSILMISKTQKNHRR